MSAPALLARASGGVRSFRPEDLPEVVALRRRIFRNSERPSPASLTAYCDEMFCHPPADGQVSPSLVHEDPAGRITGFLGVLPRRMRFRDEILDVAVATQFMVAPEQRGLAGRALARTFFAGPQTLSLSDVANDAARQLWEALGARTSPLHSLAWTLVLRPWLHRARQAPFCGAGLLRGVARFAARSLGSLADQVFGRPPKVAEGSYLAPLDATTISAAATEIFRDRALAPAYSPDSLTWLWRKCAEKRLFGEFDGAIVHDAEGDVLGWFLYYRDRAGECQLLQLAARARAQTQVLDRLAHHAWSQGGVTITGRLDPGLIGEIGVRKCVIRHEGPWTVLHTHRPEVAQAVLRGDAYLSRLEGEWWMSF